MKILFGHVICQNVGNALPFLEGNSSKFMSSDVKTRLPSHDNVKTPTSIPMSPTLIPMTCLLGSVTLKSKSKKKGNWRTLIINANGVLSKTAEIASIIDYCDLDLMLFTETKIDSSISFSEFLPNGYNGGSRRDRNKNGGGVMIVTKQE